MCFCNMKMQDPASWRPITVYGWTILINSPYCSGLALICLGPWKRNSKTQHFSNDDEVKEAICIWLRKQPKNFSFMLSFKLKIPQLKAFISPIQTGKVHMFFFMYFCTYLCLLCSNLVWNHTVLPKVLLVMIQFKKIWSMILLYFQQSFFVLVLEERSDYGIMEVLWYVFVYPNAEDDTVKSLKCCWISCFAKLGQDPNLHTGFSVLIWSLAFLSSSIKGKVWYLLYMLLWDPIEDSVV